MAGMGLSGGFAAGGGADMLEEVLKRAFLQQTERKRTAQEDRRIGQEDTRLAQQAEMQKAQLAEVAARNDAVAKLQQQQGADRTAAMLPIGTRISGATRQTLAGGDLGDLTTQGDGDTLDSRNISGMLRMATGAQPAPMKIQGQLRSTGNAGSGTFTGTAQQHAVEQQRQDQQAQIAQAAQDRKDAATAAAQTRADAAAAAQTGREDLARLTASLHGGNNDLQRQIMQAKIDAEQGKAADKKTAADNARNTAMASIDDTSSAVDELLDANGQLKPGVGGAVGLDALRSRIPGTAAADAKARIDRLQSRLTIDLLGEMKRQSRTGASGFGQLSERELAVLQQSAARLTSSQSDESFRAALIDVRKHLSDMRQRAAGPAPSPGGGARIRYDMDGNPIK